MDVLILLDQLVWQLGFIGLFVISVHSILGNPELVLYGHLHCMSDQFLKTLLYSSTPPVAL